MNLVDTYLNISLLRKKKKKTEIVYDNWGDFHKSDAKRKMVIGGRRTGKTYNLAIHAFESDLNCAIFVANENLRSFIFNAITRFCLLSEDNHLIQTNSGGDNRYSFTFPNGRKIYIYDMNSFMRYPFIDFSNMEVMFDEFDSEAFENFTTEFSDRIYNAKAITIVGSMYGGLQEKAKYFYCNSDFIGMIDSPESVYNSSSTSEISTLKPSIFREHFENFRQEHACTFS